MPSGSQGSPGSGTPAGKTAPSTPTAKIPTGKIAPTGPSAPPWPPSESRPGAEAPADRTDRLPPPGTWQPFNAAPAAPPRSAPRIDPTRPQRPAPPGSPPPPATLAAPRTEALPPLAPLEESRTEALRPFGPLEEPRTEALGPLGPLEESRTEALRPFGRLEESRTEAFAPRWGVPSAGSRPTGAGSPPALPPAARPDGEPVLGGGSRRRMWLGLAAAALILIVIATGLVVIRPAGLLGAAPASRSSPAGQLPTPLDSAPPPVLAAAGDDAPVPAADAVSAALRGPLSNPYFGTHIAVEVADATTGQQLFAQHATDPTIPASTMKLATSTALLALRGPQYQLETRVVEGSEPGSVVIIGGGDPSLAAGPTATYTGAARLDDLAAQVMRALGGITPTKVIYDSSLFSGPTAGPGWEPSDVDAGGQSARITALMTDGGRIDPEGGPEAPRYTQPDLAAAQSFAKLLGVRAAAVPGTAPSGATGQPAAAADQSGAPAPGTQLGVVKSPPVVSLIEQALANSDNTIAETMARQVALALGKPASFAGGAAAVTQELTTLGLPMGGVHIVDGSGLSHQNTLTPALLTGVLALAARSDQPRLHGLYTGLPVAGYSGTLAKRFVSPGKNPADGDVRAKTGTLSGVSSLAGYVVDARGRLLVFAAMADRVTAGTPAAQEALDQVGTALAGVS